MTIVAQFLNHHDDIKLFDEIDLIQVGRYGESVIGTLHAFLVERGVYDGYRRRARETADPAAALRAVIGEIVRPATVWGEKNPRYATQLGALYRTFPEAKVLFVLRDPRQVVNSCLAHRDSPLRAPTDFWIKDTVADALALVESCLEPLDAGDARPAVVRFEAFAARPMATLEAALGRWGLAFSGAAASLVHAAPETVGDHQFVRGGALLPWKAGNLRPLRHGPCARDRIDAADPAWAEVDALARRFDYS